MIEILVALIILAIGLLGMATLMINSLQTSQSAAMRSTATLAAYDLIERMRSNADETVLTAGSYAKAWQDASTIAKNYQPGDTCSGDTCTPAALAEHDLKAWAYALKEAVPGAKVIVKSDGTISGENRLWCIAIFWEDTGGKEVTDTNTSACGQSAKIDKKAWAFYEVKVLL